MTVLVSFEQTSRHQVVSGERDFGEACIFAEDSRRKCYTMSMQGSLIGEVLAPILTCSFERHTDLCKVLGEVGDHLLQLPFQVLAQLTLLVNLL